MDKLYVRDWCLGSGKESRKLGVCTEFLPKICLTFKFDIFFSLAASYHEMFAAFLIVLCYNICDIQCKRGFYDPSSFALFVNTW